ncbi:MAG: hypothetical protein O7G30_11930 [Proteobacteria bacterium]|nr:hypothetical protein [Pseudomonadota bacterium]
MRNRARWLGTLAAVVLARGKSHALAFALLLPGPSAAALRAIELSPDTTIAIGGEVLGPEEVGEDDLAGTVVFTGVGVALPAGTNVTAFGTTAGGDLLFSTDVTVNLGGVVARPGDVVLVSGGVPSLAFDAADNGLPAGVQVDAVAEAADGSLLVSFDVTVALDGTTFGDEDIVRLDIGSGLASLEFDGSAEGVADGLDLDAADELASGNLLISFDGSGELGGVNFDDEDLLEFDPVEATFAMVYDGSVEHANWAASDLDAADASDCVFFDTVCDGVINILDVQRVLNIFGASAGDPDFNLELDLVADGTINILDVQTVLNHFGEQAPFGVSAAAAASRMTCGLGVELALLAPLLAARRRSIRARGRMREGWSRSADSNAQPVS